MMNHPAVRDGALLLLRIVLGVILIAHAWQKYALQGLQGPNGVIANFQALGVPQPRLSAWFSVAFEFLAGGMLILGFLSTVVAVLLVFYMLTVMYVVHVANGFFVTGGGVEFVLLIVVSALIIVAFGPGRVSVDRVLHAL